MTTMTNGNLLLAALQHCEDTDAASTLFRLAKDDPKVLQRLVPFQIPGGLDTATVASARRHNVDVTTWAVMNATTVEGLEAHIGDSRKAVRLAMAANPNCSRKTSRWLLECAAKSRDGDLLTAVLKNCHPSDAVDILVGSTHWELLEMSRDSAFVERRDLGTADLVRLAADIPRGEPDRLRRIVCGVAAARLVETGHLDELSGVWNDIHIRLRTSRTDYPAYPDEINLSYATVGGVAAHMLHRLGRIDADTIDVVAMLAGGNDTDRHWVRTVTELVAQWPFYGYRSRIDGDHPVTITRAAVEKLSAKMLESSLHEAIGDLVCGPITLDDHNWAAGFLLDVLANRYETHAGGASRLVVVLNSLMYQLQRADDPTLGARFASVVSTILADPHRRVSHGFYELVANLTRDTPVPDTTESEDGSRSTPTLTAVHHVVSPEELAEVISALLTAGHRYRTVDVMGALLRNAGEDYVRRCRIAITARTDSTCMGALIDRVDWRNLDESQRRAMYRALGRCVVSGYGLGPELLMDFLQESFPHRPDALAAAVQMAASGFVGSAEELVAVIDLLHPASTEPVTIAPVVVCGQHQQLALL